MLLQVLLGAFQQVSALSTVSISPNSARNCLEQPPGWPKAFWWSAVAGLPPPEGQNGEVPICALPEA
eukprot:11654023-Alexandrium_andersonii.AAC.1